MKKVVLLFAICGVVTLASCAKKQCPAYGSVKTSVVKTSERV